MALQIKYIEKTIHDMFKVWYYTKANWETAQQRIRQLALRLKELNFTEEEIKDYIEHTHKPVKKIKDKMKRSNLAYFIAIIANENNLARFVDYNNAMKEAAEEAPPADTQEMQYNGKHFRYLTEIGDCTVFYFYDKVKLRFLFLVKDHTEIVPKTMYLSAYIKSGGKVKRSKMEQLARSKHGTSEDSE